MSLGQILKLDGGTELLAVQAYTAIYNSNRREALTGKKMEGTFQDAAQPVKRKAGGATNKDRPRPIANGVVRP